MKPGIIYGNAVTAVAGFLLASAHEIRYLYLIETVLGISVVIGSACVFNNVIDRKIDSRMKRTSRRATATGTVTPAAALIFASVLGVVGFAILSYYTNMATIVIGVIGYLDYIFAYAYYKRKSSAGTLVGSISGAMPILAGYCAVHGSINSAAVLLFLILVIWQMPHFYAIAIAQIGDYKNAGLPVLPVRKGIRRTKQSMLWYIAIFVAVSVLLTTFGFTGYAYSLVMIFIGLYWYLLALRGLHSKDDRQWARSVFKFSLVVIMVFSIMVSFGNRLI